jgi:hypothetical protein
MQAQEVKFKRVYGYHFGPDETGGHVIRDENDFKAFLSNVPSKRTHYAVQVDFSSQMLIAYARGSSYPTKDINVPIISSINSTDGGLEVEINEKGLSGDPANGAMDEIKPYEIVKLDRFEGEVAFKTP